MTVSTFYPDSGDPAANVVDGYVGRVFAAGSGEAWGTIRDNADGNETASTEASNTVQLGEDNGAGRWRSIRRAFTLFNTGPTIPDADVISAATYEQVSSGTSDGLSALQSIRMVTVTPASNTTLANADYDQLGTVAQAPDKTIASITVDVTTPTFNVYTLNATGRGNISKTSITKFGTRMVSDADNAEPTNNNGAAVARSFWQSADEADAADTRPKLIVTHAAVAFVPRAIFF